MNEVTKVCRMIQRYNEYKDSGVQWLGEIPSHWACMSLLYALRSKICDGPHETPNYIDTGIPFISIDSLNDSDHIDFTNVRRFISEEDYQRYCQKTVIEKNDILFSKAATIGKTAIVGDEKFMVWSPLAVLKPSSKFIITRYLYHLLCNKKVIDDVSLSGSESTQINVGMRELEKLRIPVPTLPEQQAIATYLDEATSKIDAAIAQQQKMIDLLNERKQIIINNAVTKGLNPNVKMKDSGVEWIGEIPEHWEVNKLKNCAKTNSGSTPRSIAGKENPTSTVRWVRTTDLHNNVVEDTSEYISEKEMSSASCPWLPVNTVLISMYGGAGSFGKVGLLNIEATINQALCSINCNFSIMPKFIFYYLQSVHRIWMKYAASSRKDPNLNQEIIRNLDLVIPPLAEQERIIVSIEEKLESLRTVLDCSERQIALLQERKQLIINEVVTGKVKVC